MNMNIGGLPVAGVQTQTQIQGYGEAGPAAGVDSSGKTAPAQDSVNVALRGQQLMMSRLFGVDDPSKLPQIQTRYTMETSMMGPSHFLTQGDRATLANIYAYAESQGMDLEYVDLLAFDMGIYRQEMTSGVTFLNRNDGGFYDMEGHLKTWSFTEKDAATAERILNGSAIGATALDRGFLQFELDPGYNANHGANFDFLEAMVNHFSAADTPAPANGAFASFRPEGLDNYIVHTSEDVQLPPSDPDITGLDGVFTITETGYKNGWRWINGEPVQLTPMQLYLESQSLSPESAKQSLVEALLAPKPEPMAGMKPSWLTMLQNLPHVQIFGPNPPKP
jgi:hypothetical protein